MAAGDLHLLWAGEDSVQEVPAEPERTRERQGCVWEHVVTWPLYEGRKRRHTRKLKNLTGLRLE